MKKIVPVILGAAAILVGLTIAIINEGHYLKGYGWALPYLLALIVLLVLLAAVILLNPKTEQENKTEQHTPATVHQENRQEFNPQFNPQIIIGGSPPAPAELDETAKGIRTFMKSAHAHSAYKADEIATEFNLTNSSAWAELKKLQAEGWARPVETDQGTLWMFYDKEL